MAVADTTAENATYGAGDSRLLENVLPESLTNFDILRNEIEWHEMSHKGGPVPRLVSIQGTLAPDGAYPVYRHPAEEQPKLVPWTSTVAKIKSRVEEVVGYTFNHALIQLYRNGDDNISEHADKTLDIVKGTPIINVSLGATRTMVFRLKSAQARSTKGQSQKVKLPNNSVFVLGWETNRDWLHAINKDGRLPQDKSADELSQDGQRISLTFRVIGTFRHPDGSLHGQGALAVPRPLSLEEEAVELNELLQAFNMENRTQGFVWEHAYGRGFGLYNVNEVSASSAGPARRTVLLVIDLQKDFLSTDPQFFMASRSKRPDLKRVLPAVQNAVSDVRKAGGAVIWVRAVYGGWLDDQPSPKRPPSRDGLTPNDDFHACTHKGKQVCCQRQSAGVEFDDEVSGMIQETDFVLEKRWYSCFTETPLQAMLDAWGIKRVGICGVVTGVCVQATMCDAAHLGYEAVLIKDACASNVQREEQEEETFKFLSQYGPLTDSKHFGSYFPALSLRQKMAMLEFDGLTRLSGFGAGDCLLVPNFFPRAVADALLKDMLLTQEIDWTQLTHLKHGGKFPRLTAFQAQRSPEEHLPVYRCADPQPWDGQYQTKPFSPSVAKIKERLEEVAGHSFNWCRILRYRNGNDGMGFHCDKCLDLRHGSYIASLSLGESRVYELQPKQAKTSRLPSQSLTLHHNTLLLLGPETNRLFLHALKKSKNSQKAERISVTFRDVATYFVHVDRDCRDFYGQGTLCPTFESWQKQYNRDRFLEFLAAGILLLPVLQGPVRKLIQDRRKSFRDLYKRFEQVILRVLVAGILQTVVCAGRMHWNWEEGRDRRNALFPLLNAKPISSREAVAMLHSEGFAEEFATFEKRRARAISSARFALASLFGRSDRFQSPCGCD